MIYPQAFRSRKDIHFTHYYRNEYHDIIHSYKPKVTCDGYYNTKTRKTNKLIHKKTLFSFRDQNENRYTIVSNSIRDGARVNGGRKGRLVGVGSRQWALALSATVIV